MTNTVSGTQIGVMMHDCLTYLSACSQLYSFLCGYAVAGVEYGCRGNGPEHGHVLQAHQRWAFFSCRTSTAFHIEHSEMEQPVKHRVHWRMQIYVHMQCSTCTGSLLTASRGDKKGEKRVTGPKGLSEGKHRIRGNKRITNTSRWHIYLLGIVWKIGERDKKVNLVKTCGGSRKREGGRALCTVHRLHLTNQWTGRSGSHTNWCCCPRWPRCEAGHRHGWKRMRECWQKQGSSHGQRIPWQHWPEARI